MAYSCIFDAACLVCGREGGVGAEDVIVDLDVLDINFML